MSNSSNLELNNLKQQVPNGEIDILQLLKIIWQGKWGVIAITFVFAIGSIVYAKSLPNIYRSEALLSPATEKKVGTSGLSQLSGLASLAGVNIGASGGIDKTTLAIETLKSKDFLNIFIVKYELKKKLFNDAESQMTTQQACAKLYSMISIVTDNKTNMIRIAFENESPELAKELLMKLIVEINSTMKNRDLEEAQKSIEYLNNQISQTNLAEMKAVLFQLVEDQTKTLMLVNVHEEYIFKTIDPAFVPEEKFKPNRTKICILGILMGITFGVGLLLSKNAFLNRNII